MFIIVLVIVRIFKNFIVYLLFIRDLEFFWRYSIYILEWYLKDCIIRFILVLVNEFGYLFLCEEILVINNWYSVTVRVGEY